MKKNIIYLVLIMSINSSLFAQKSASVTNADKLFEMPQDNISRRYIIDLEKGNKMQLELSDLTDLDHLSNIDSILRVFVQDIEPLKDSLVDDIASKRIDYISDQSGKNKLRIRQTTPAGSSYLVNQGAVSAMKMEQDTINLFFTTSSRPAKLYLKKSEGFHYYRVSFFLNNLSDLAAYLDGRLSIKINTLRDNANGKWIKDKNGMAHIKNSPSIYSPLFRGQVPGSGDVLNLRAYADIQNYKNYFIPSLSFEASVVTTHYNIKRTFGFAGELHFTFAKNNDGKLETSISKFLTVSYSQSNASSTGNIKIPISISLGYLVKQQADVFDKNTFRLGFGKTSILGGKGKIEPVIYFNNFFKNVTPGLRVSF